MTERTLAGELPATSLAARFLAFEDRLGLLDRRVTGAYPWERLRFHVFRRLETELEGIGPAKPAPGTRLFQAVRSAALAARSLMGQDALRAPRSDLLVVGTPRRVLRDDGLWWDPQCDTWLDSAAKSWVYVEQAYAGHHRRPARTRKVHYLDRLDFLAKARRALGLARVDVSSEEWAWWEAAQHALRREFGVDLPLASLVRRTLVARHSELPLFRQLLRRVRPTQVVVVCSYGKESLLEACRLHGIPVTELQHGVIHPAHMGYAFPRSPKRQFPDRLLTFGVAWNSAASFPPTCDVQAVGYPFHDEQRRAHPHRPTARDVVFLSQGTIGEHLSRFAVDVARMAPGLRDRIVYKLHPGEVDQWQARYPWLAASGVRVVDGPRPSLYELLSKASTQVGVFSTALYEGLGYGLPTYIVRAPGWESMEHVVTTGWAELAGDAASLAQALERPSSMAQVDGELLFKACTGSEFAAAVLRPVTDSSM